MNKIVLLTIATMLTACGKSEAPDTMDSLTAHPDRLREVERKCVNHDTSMTAVECNAASEARRRLFMGNGPQYTPSKDTPKF